MQQTAGGLDARTVLAFGRFDLQPHLLRQGAADEPTDAVGLPASRFHDVGEGRSLRPSFRDRASADEAARSMVVDVGTFSRNAEELAAIREKMARLIGRRESTSTSRT